MMKYCNSLSMSKLNVDPRSVFVITKRLARCVPRGRFFYAQCSMINTQCIMHNSQ